VVKQQKNQPISRVLNKVPEGSTPIFEDTQISLQLSAGKANGNLHIVNQLDLFSHRCL